jgi:nitroreductase
MDVKEAIESRRAWRSLAPTSIGRETIEELARCASLSASCYNKQPWRYEFAAGGEKLDEMRGALAKGNEWAKKASMIIAVHSRIEDDCLVAGREYYLFDTGMATALLILRAVELGLVAHPIAGFDEEKVKAAFGLDGDETVITLVIVGLRADRIDPDLTPWQKESEEERPERLPFEKIARIYD